MKTGQLFFFVMACSVGGACAEKRVDKPPRVKVETLAEARITAPPEVAVPKPVATAAPAKEGRVRYPAHEILSPFTTEVARHLRSVGSKGLDLHDARFIKVGGSGSSTPLLLSCFDGRHVDLGDWKHLKGAHTRFLESRIDGESSFGRKSLAAKPGATAHWALEGESSPLQAEIAAVLPRFALVHYGTNDMVQKGNYVASAAAFLHNMIQLVDTLVARGVIPIVTAITPREDNPAANGWIPSYNALLRSLAERRLIPFLDLHTAILSLPGRGRAEDKLHGNVYRQGGAARPCVFTEDALAFSYNVRNLLTLRMLDRLMGLLRFRKDPVPATEFLEGEGLSKKPWEIESLPFAHMADTSRSLGVDGESYKGCEPHAKVGGPEITYRLVPKQNMRIRAMVLGARGVDVDLFLLEEGDHGVSCLRHGDRGLTRQLVAGISYRLVVETRTVDESPQWGEFVLVVTPCEAGEDFCE